MKTQKHTPGPWQLSYLPFADTDNGIDLKGNNGNTLIANFPTPFPVEGVAYRPGEEDAANLQLIAAAPELLVALESLVADWERVHGPIPFDHEARAAIAKATGGDQ